MSTTGRHHLGRLAEQSFERRGDYPALLFEGRWHGSAELFERGRRIAGAVGVSGALCGLAMGCLAGAAGGSLGRASLADFGPVGWLTGVVAAGWVCGVGVPVGLAVWWWRVRPRGAAEPIPVPERERSDPYDYVFDEPTRAQHWTTDE